MTDLERLRELSEKATQGEWIAYDAAEKIAGIKTDADIGSIAEFWSSALPSGATLPARANVDFIIACVNYVRAALSAPAQGDAEAVAWRPIETAPKDGTHILAILVREGVHDIDDIWRAEFREVREIWYRPYEQFGMFMPWHAGDPFDAHDGVAPENMGEGIPKFWMPLSSLKTGDRSPSPAPEAEKLREALRPFAKAAGIIEWTEKVTHQSFDGNAPFKSGLAWQEDGETRTLTYDDFRRARAALKEKASEAE